MQPDAEVGEPKRLPDLPGLESVEVKLRERPVAASIAFLLVAGFAGLGGYAYMRLGEYARDVLPQLAVAEVLAGGTCVYCLWRLLLADFHWRTNADGLYSRNLVRSKFRRWEDRLCPTELAGKVPTLSELTALDASVWQHLRRDGKTDESALSSSALTFWDAIPDALPLELEWKNPRPLRRSWLIWCTLSGLLAAVGVGLLLASLLTRGHSDFLGWAAISWFYAVLLIPPARMNKMQPEHLSLKGTDIQARFVGRALDLKPEDVTHAWWGEPGIFHLRTRNAHFTIALDSIHEESSQMVLAVIRWLRMAPKPVLVVIPEVLRSFPDRGRELTGVHCADDRVELRLSRADRIAILVLVAIFTALFTAMGLRNVEPMLAVVATTIVTVTISAVAWWIAGKSGLCADCSGITKFIAWSKERVEWRDVADYSIGNKAGSGAANTSMRCTLWSAEGRELCAFRRTGRQSQRGIGLRASCSRGYPRSCPRRSRRNHGRHNLTSDPVSPPIPSGLRPALARRGRGGRC